MRTIIIAGLLGLGACVATQPADPAITAKIVKTCMSSGLFKLVNGAIATAVPQATIPIALVDAGVDQVCAHPETYSADASTVEWLVAQLKAAKK